MLVKKKKDGWTPSEAPGLQIGDTVEITNPRDLILAGFAVGVGKNGEELGPYELYDVLTTDEREEYEKFLAMKKQEGIKKHLEEEKETLEKQLKEAEEKVVKKETVATEEKKEVKVEKATTKKAKKK